MGLWFVVLYAFGFDLYGSFLIHRCVWFVCRFFRLRWEVCDLRPWSNRNKSAPLDWMTLRRKTLFVGSPKAKRLSSWPPNERFFCIRVWIPTAARFRIGYEHEAFSCRCDVIGFVFAFCVGIMHQFVCKARFICPKHLHCFKETFICVLYNQVINQLVSLTPCFARILTGKRFKCLTKTCFLWQTGAFLVSFFYTWPSSLEAGRTMIVMFFWLYQGGLGLGGLPVIE